MDIDAIVKEITRLTDRNPNAVMMRGPNPIAPNCPMSGVYAVGSWASTTKHIRYKNAPEGWDVLEAREAAGELTPFVVIWPADGNGYCIVLDDDDCYLPLVPPPSACDIRDTAEYFADHMNSDW